MCPDLAVSAVKTLSGKLYGLRIATNPSLIVSLLLRVLSLSGTIWFINVSQMEKDETHVSSVIFSHQEFLFSN